MVEIAKIEDDAHLREGDKRPVDVLAFGSKLLYGSVGLSAAEPVYFRAGLRLIAIPTITLSNLPHYPSVHTIPVEAEWLTDALGDLAAIGALSELPYVTVGYLVDPEQTHALGRWFTSLSQTYAQPQLILDPTLGDEDVQFYTDPAVAAAQREALVPLATGMTPNRFELAQLTGRDLIGADLQEIVSAARSLLVRDDQWVVVTGLEQLEEATEQAGEHPEIANVLVTANGEHVFRYTLLETTMKGLGDIFTAMLISELVAGRDLPAACDAAGSGVHDYISQHS